MFITSFELRELGSTSYINDLPLVRSLLGAGPVKLNSPVTFLVGENGSGKSTLLEALAVAMRFNAEGGSRNVTFSRPTSVSELHHWLAVQRFRNPRDGYFFRAESMYLLYTYMYKEVIDLSMHFHSHGEILMKLVRERLHPGGLFIMDEPESGLSPDTLMELVGRISILAEKGAQFIIATHSPLLLTVPGAQILQLSDGHLEEVAFADSDLVAAYREFLGDPHGTAEFLCEP